MDLNPGKSYGYVALAEVLSTMGLTDKGLHLLEQVEFVPDLSDWRIQYTIARLQTSGKQPTLTEILRRLQRALKDPAVDTELVHRLMANVLNLNLDRPQARNFLENYHPPVSSRALEIIKAKLLTDQGRYRLALKKLHKAEKEFGSSPELILQTAILKMKHLGMKRSAQKALQKLVANFTVQDRDFTSLSAQQVVIFSTAHTLLGSLNLSKNQNRNALENFKQATLISQRNSFATASSVLDLMDKQRRHTMQVSYLDWISEEMPGNAAFYAVKGEIMMEKLNRLPEAIEAFSNAIILQPDHGPYFNSLGLAYYKTKRHKLALQAFERAISLNPADALSVYNKACMLALLGRKEAALDQLAVAVELDPDLAKTARKDPDLLGLQNHPVFKSIINRKYLGDNPIDPENQP